MQKKLVFIVVCCLISCMAGAEIIEKEIEYNIDGVVHQGYIFHQDGIAAKRPGILVVHEWKGISDHVMASAKELAGQGYIAMAVDIYGKGVRPADNQEAAKLSGSYKKDRALLRKKILAAYEQLISFDRVDMGKIAAIGYCFGGTTVLELARSGAVVSGVVSFHGGLDSPAPEDARNIKGKVLVLHGGIDPHVPDSEVAGFIKEMRDAKVDWQLFYYGTAVHSFTSKAAGNDPSKGSAYHELTAKRSWQAMLQFFNEIFAES